MFEIGRVCVKTAGRDAGKYCVVLSEMKDSMVLIDGQTRRRKCNVSHLEPTTKTLDVSAEADLKAVEDAFATIGVEVVRTTPKNAAPKPVKKKVVKGKSSEKDAGSEKGKKSSKKSE